MGTTECLRLQASYSIQKQISKLVVDRLERVVLFLERLVLVLDPLAPSMPGVLREVVLDLLEAEVHYEVHREVREMRK